MKKIISGVIVIVIISYVLIQNGGRIFLIALSQHRLVNPFLSTHAASTAGGKPPTYKDGTYTGAMEDAFYGNVQVQVLITHGKINNIQFLQHPSDAMRSVAINDIAMPNLTQEAIQAQQANIDIVSGATQTSQAFIQSLQSALNQAKS
jgi:uncharacterized protein with FMN-binding domain